MSYSYRLRILECSTAKIRDLLLTVVLPQLVSPTIAMAREPSDWLKQEWQDKYITL